MNSRSSRWFWLGAVGLSLWLVALVHAAVPLTASASASAPGDFEAIALDYKKPQVLTETFFNPFHVQTSIDAIQKKSGAAVTDEAVIEAVAARGISGVISSAQHGSARVIMGDQVFNVGEEMSFPDEVTGAALPLVKGASVVLRRVSRESLGLDVSPETEPTRRVNIPLRSFWRP